MRLHRPSKMIVSGLLLALSAGVVGAGAPAASASEVSPLLIGSTLPELELRTSEGSAYDLNAAIEGTPTILMFYRGGW